MTRSTDTSHRQPYRAASRATAASIGSGPQAWSRTLGAGGTRGQRAFERNGHAAALAARSVFGAQHQRDAALLEVVQIEQVGVASPAVEEREPHTAPGQPLGDRPERGQADTAGDHPDIGGRVRQRESTPQRTETLDALSGFGVEDLRGRHPDALAENRDADGAVAVPENLEHRKRPAQQRVDAAIGLHHHELPGLGGAGNFGGLEAQHVVIGGKTAVLDHPRVDVEGHGESITSAGCRVPGAGCRVPGAWCSVRCLVPGASCWCVCRVPGARHAALHRARRTRHSHHALAPGTGTGPAPCTRHEAPD